MMLAMSRFPLSSFLYPSLSELMPMTKKNTETTSAKRTAIGKKMKSKRNELKMKPLPSSASCFNILVNAIKKKTKTLLPRLLKKKRKFLLLN